MRQSKQAEEMMDLMKKAEAIAQSSGLDKEDKADVLEAALKTAKAIWGKDVDKKQVKKIAMDACDQASSPAEAIELVQNVMRSNEANEMIWTPTDTKGPGAKSYKDPNSYTRDEVMDLLKYVAKFVKSGSQKDSFNVKADQDWLDKVGTAMSQFVSLRKGDPGMEYKEGDMKAQAADWGYAPNKHDKANSSSKNDRGPGSVRGKEIDKDIQ